MSALVPIMAGCTAPNPTNEQRHQMVQVLELEMKTNTDWIRIHAADALIDHGCVRQVSDFFTPELEPANSPRRVGNWRILARCARTPEQRDCFKEKIRSTMLDSQAPDRLQAAESLAKLGCSMDAADIREIENWVLKSDEATAVFPVWLTVRSSNPDNLLANEARVAKYLDSKDPIARLRAAFALGRLSVISDSSRERLRQQMEVEPSDSPARVYILAALLLHTPRGSALESQVKRLLSNYLNHGQPNEQSEAAIVLGMRGSTADLRSLAPLLKSSRADVRVGAASGTLYILQ